MLPQEKHDLQVRFFEHRGMPQPFRVNPKIESESFETLCKQTLFRINRPLSLPALLPHTNVHHYFYNSRCIRYGPTVGSTTHSRIGAVQLTNRRINFILIWRERQMAVLTEL